MATRRRGRGGRTTRQSGSHRSARAEAARPEVRAADAAPPGAAPAGTDLTIVGVGASAGGLEAFSQLLHALPTAPGISIVFVQHLAPHHESALATLLSMQTSLPVVQATDNMRIERDHVYVIPPNVQAAIANRNELKLLPRPTDRTQYNPIDFFLRSLSESAADRAIGVILSGTASDGTQGVRDIDAMGGFTFAQTPETARYDGMPRAAIATGLVDLVLPPDQIATELVRVSRAPVERPPADSQQAPPGLTSHGHMETVLGLLRTATGVDFTRYKAATIHRRLQRRMVLHRLDGIGHYVQFAQENPTEVQALYQDILIHVTRFFREPDAFDALKQQILPRIVEQRRGDQPIRLWVCGCSTGEEAYSLAIVLLEVLEENASGVPVQLFATDVSDIAVEHAREGRYPESIRNDVSPERLRRFFTKTDGGYGISTRVRDVCVFARQDVTRDPPFSRLDLILCRNVLIYMGAELQKKIMTVFHYALRPTGYLMLGHAETVGTHADLFVVSDKRHRIFHKKMSALPSLTPPDEYPHAVAAVPRRQPASGRDDGHALQREADRVIQDRYAPPGVVVDGHLQIVQFRGQTGSFLEPAPGDPSLSVLKMAREGLLYALRSAVSEARKLEASVRKDGLRVRANGGWLELSIEVIPLQGIGKQHFLILFHEKPPERSSRRPERPSRALRPGSRLSKTASQLEQELQSSREYLQSIIQELEAANEELESANEEILSANEELQSTNEELDTAKEELQSTNEELNTVNEELQGRNEELSRVNSDLLNLLASVQIAIVIVAADLRIRRFTPMAERVLNLIPADVGRPIGHIKPNIECADLEEMILDVIERVHPREREVRDRQGRSLSLHIRPYKNLENRIDGAVLALFDVDAVRQQADENRDFVSALVDTVREPVMVLDGSLRVKMVNQTFEKVFRLPRSEAEGQLLYDVSSGRWRTSSMRRLLEQVLPSERHVHDFVLERSAASDGGPARVLVNARRIEANREREALVFLTIAPAGDDEDRHGRE